MKIGEITSTPLTDKNPEVSKDKPSAGSANFENLLSKELASSADSSTTVQSVQISLPEPAGITSVTPTPETAGCPAVNSGVTSAVESTAENLDMIDKSLSSPALTLKSVGAAINSLSNEADRLQETLSSLPTEHPLKQAGDEISVLAYVESVKWNRGDYV